MRPVLVLLLSLTAVLTSACGTSRSRDQLTSSGPPMPASAAADQLSLPAPAALLRHASGPPADNERGCFGSSAASFLPWNKYSFGTFSPNWTPGGGQTINNAAYATYEFTSMAGYAGKKRVLLGWSPAPAASDVFVGLANFTADRWDWYRVDSGFSASLPDLARYTAPDERLWACVAVLGIQGADLDYILVGDTFIEQAALESDLDPDPTKNTGPRDVTLDAHKSAAWGAPIASFDWDFDNDGVWDQLATPGAYATHTYQPGNYTAQVRVNSADGASGTRTLSFLIIDPANQPPVAQFNADQTSGSAPLGVAFDAAGSSDPDGQIVKYEWDFDGDGKFEFDAGAVETASYIFGRKGATSATLRVTDNDLATDTWSVDIALLHGWSSVVIDNAVQVVGQVALGVTGGADPRPCVAYLSNAEHDLRFAVAANASGSLWQPWTTPVGTAGDSGYSPGVVTLVGDGAPLLSYGKFNPGTGQYDLYVVSATDASAGSWNLPVQVAPGLGLGFDASLALINTIPAFAATDIGNSQPVYYILAQNAAGTSWNAAQVAVPGAVGVSYAYVGLGAVGGGLFKHPAVCYSRSGSNFNDAGLASASDVDGTAWNPAQYFPGITAFSSSMLTVDGNPALLLGNPYQGGVEFYARAGDADGQNWPAPQQVGGGGWGRLALLNGRPVTCYGDEEGIDLYFLGAVDADGSAWNAPYIVDSPGYTGQFCDITIADGNPLICYYDLSNNRLKAAYWQ
jgi:PKD repeat protein